MVDETGICNLDGITIKIIPKDKIRSNIKIEEFGDLNKCRLKFQLVLYDSKIKEITQEISKPVFSEVIRNKTESEFNNSESNVVSNKIKQKKRRLLAQNYCSKQYEWLMDILNVPKVRNNTICDLQVFITFHINFCYFRFYKVS